MTAPRVVMRTAPFRVPAPDRGPAVAAALRQAGRQVMVAAAVVLAVTVAALLVIGWVVGAGPWPAVLVVAVLGLASAGAALVLRARDRRPS